MDQLQQKSVLLAPTGRAAKVFSVYAGHPAFTIHKKIYRQQAFSNELSNFSINDNLATNTLFIVDEASMISNEDCRAVCLEQDVYWMIWCNLCIRDKVADSC